MLEKLWKVKALYLLLWPGIGNVGNLTKIDAMIVQSFGRNTCTDAKWAPFFLNLCLKTVDNNNEEMFGLLKKVGFDPGEMNYSLAGETVCAIEKLSIKKIIVQWEIGYAIWDADPAFFRKTLSHIEVAWPIGQKYMSSEAVIDQALKIAKSCSLEKIACLSHKRMEARIFLSTVGKMEDIAEVVCIGSNVAGFSRRSVQWWTRGPIRWMIREVIVRAYLLAKGLV